MSTRKRRNSRLAPAVGAFAGLLAGYAVASGLHVAPGTGQLPGFALENGFDPKRDVFRLAILLGSCLAGGAVARIAWRGRTIAAGSGAVSLRTSPCPEPSTRGLLAPAVIAHALAVWTLLLVPLVPLGVSPLGLFAAVASLSLALAVVLGKGRPSAGSPYLGAACPILVLGFLGTTGPVRSFVAAAVGFGLPVLARAAAGHRPGLTRTMRALTLVVLLPGSVTAMAAGAVMRSPRILDVFEDGHALLPASEYLRGELPYRDIVPGHGLLSDGLLASIQLRVFGDDIGGMKRGEKVSGALFWPAFYAVGYAATASPAFALGGLLLSFTAFPQYQNPRAIASLWALALAIYASRSKRRGAWLAWGAAVPLGLCIAVDFAFYATCGGAVALWVARGRRQAHLAWLALGAAASAALIGVALAAFGILGGFLRTTFVYVPSLLPVYAQGFPTVARPHGLSQWLGLFGDETALLYGFTAASLVLLGAYLPQAPRVGARVRAMLPVCAWTLAAMLSVLERQHVGYAFLAVPVGLLLMVRWVRGWSPWMSVQTAGAVLVPALLVWNRQPASLLAGVAYATAHTPLPTGMTRLAEPPRARGGLFRSWDENLVFATADVLRKARMGPDDTWFDFGHAPGLYYLFDRDCPIRYYEPGFYETESAQREVIAALEANPRVRAALVSAGYPPGYGAIDGVPNSRRTPLVYAYLEERFRPFYSRDGIEFWLRKDAAGVTSGLRESSTVNRP